MERLGVFMRNNLTWDRRSALLLLIAALPSLAMAMFVDATLGLAGLVGLLPAVFVGVAPKRKGRVAMVLLSVMIPLLLLLGTLVKMYLNVWLAALALAAAGYVAVMYFAAKGVMLAMNFIVPLLGIGLSFESVDKALAVLALMLASSGFACCVAMLFPEFEPQERPRPAPLAPQTLKQYRYVYCAALAVATLCSFSMDHAGWVVGSMALVMRPNREAQLFRSLWRVVSVAVGMSIVTVVMLLVPRIEVVAALSLVALVVAGGLHKSKLYIMPLFISCVTFSLMFYAEQQTKIVGVYLERLLWVAIGVAIAYVFGVVLPKLMARTPEKQCENRAA